jgi:hypothetical protein
MGLMDLTKKFEEKKAARFNKIFTENEQNIAIRKQAKKRPSATKRVLKKQENKTPQLRA